MILWGPPGTGKTTLARLIASGAVSADPENPRRMLVERSSLGPGAR